MNADIKILMIDDDRSFTELVSEFFKAESGFELSVCHDGQAGITAVQTSEVDVIVLDVGMPVMNGFECLKAIRRFSDVPIIMLTARGDDLDRILGLEIGADDYVPKPCHLRELMARIRVIMRRVRPTVVSKKSSDITLDDLRLAAGAQATYLNGQVIDLTGAEYLVLEILLKSAGEVVDKDSIARYALGRRIMPFDRSVDAHVSHIRKKLGPLDDGQQRIKTVRGRGYLYVSNG